MFLNIPYAVFGYNETRDVHKIHIHSNLAHVKQIMSILLRYLTVFTLLIVQYLTHFAVQSDDAKCHRDQKGSIHPSKTNNQAKNIRFLHYTQ